MLASIGVWCLLCWAALRIHRPGPFLLRNTPGRPNRLNVFHVVGLLLVMLPAQMGLALLLARLTGTELAPGRPVPMSVSLPTQTIVQVAVLALSLATAAKCFRHGLRRGLGLRGNHWLWDIARGVGGLLIILPAVVGTLVATQWVFEWLDWPRQAHPLLEQLLTAPLGWQAAAIFGAVVLAPLAEEVLFRGLLQSMLRTHFGHPWPAVIVASLMFASVHATAEPQGVPALFVLSLALGYNYERTGRLWSPIVLHAVFNAAMIWGQFVQPLPGA